MCASIMASDGIQVLTGLPVAALKRNDPPVTTVALRDTGLVNWIHVEAASNAAPSRGRCSLTCKEDIDNKLGCILQAHRGALPQLHRVKALLDFLAGECENSESRVSIIAVASCFAQPQEQGVSAGALATWMYTAGEISTLSSFLWP